MHVAKICSTSVFRNYFQSRQAPDSQASAVNSIPAEYLDQGSDSFAAQGVLQSRRRRDCSSNTATAMLELHINLIFLRGAACKLGQLSAYSDAFLDRRSPPGSAQISRSLNHRFLSKFHSKSIRGVYTTYT